MPYPYKWRRWGRIHMKGEIVRNMKEGLYSRQRSKVGRIVLESSHSSTSGHGSSNTLLNFPQMRAQDFESIWLNYLRGRFTYQALRYHIRQDITLPYAIHKIERQSPAWKCNISFAAGSAFVSDIDCVSLSYSTVILSTIQCKLYCWTGESATLFNCNLE